ncbi:hypothetical protein SRB5_47070 [Streptomyces sp. RB5]|uniref:Thiosulfate dehydrogenase [quinone] large subunit n=1 Tax=Streptomyces smaragdinus TaxID=2585196 RepID=A0A7K0CM28_9ACTN|nr:DoxX family membrane protein [Streptomyces smaragdinus]MQY14539.1 hypothetical protein [Streptomyces smaragdinus]
MAVQHHPERHQGFHLPSLRIHRAAGAAEAPASPDTTEAAMTTTTAAPATTTTVAVSAVTARVLAGVRVLTGFIFLWAFLDKTFGLNYATASERAWTEGGSPTKGFLSGVAVGPMQGTLRDWAGAGWADWLFMLGMLGIGVALILGFALKPAAVAATVMMALMWIAEWPLAQHNSMGDPTMSSNPLVDYHVMYAVTAIALAALAAGNTWGLGKTWAKLPVVRDHTWLR